MSIAVERPKQSEPKLTHAAPTLVVFSDDWGRHPSSSQHLVGHLLDDFDVIWVNTIGMCKPQINWDTVRRAVGKARQWVGAKHPRPDVLPKRLKILNPPMWPYFAHQWDRAINRRLLRRSLQRELAECSGEVIAVTTIPLVADLVDDLPVDRWVYYCVDDFSVWPGLDGTTLQKMEQELVGKVDAVIAVSEVLKDKHHCDDRELLTHGIDLDFWSRPSSRPDWLQDYEPPYVVFWGLIDRRMDVLFLDDLSQRLSQGSILLVGPTESPDSRLKSLARVHLPGKLPFEQLPSLAHAADVLIMPYADLPVTRAMQPLKLKEYLATGKPVVASNLPAVQPWSDALDAVTTPDEFTTAALNRLGQTIPEEQAVARSRLQQESWAGKAAQFADLLGLYSK